MSKDDIFNAVCAVYFQEEVRLIAKISELEYMVRYRGADDQFIVELIKARARLEYFRSFVREMLEYIQHFDK